MNTSHDQTKRKSEQKACQGKPTKLTKGMSRPISNVSNKQLKAGRVEMPTFVQLQCMTTNNWATPNMVERHIKIDNPQKCTKGMSSPCASSTLRVKRPQQSCTMNTHLLLQIMKLLRPTPASARRLDDSNGVRQTNPLDQQPTHMWPLLRRAQSSREVGLLLSAESQCVLCVRGALLHNAQTRQQR